jgi:hypothetical protein
MPPKRTKAAAAKSAKTAQSQPSSPGVVVAAALESLIKELTSAKKKSGKIK